MIFRQLFDPVSSTFTYLLASGVGREAVIIDPVRDKVADYLELIGILDLKLVFAIDTHTHADHITGLGALREATQCITLMGDRTRAECVSRRLRDAERLQLDGLRLTSRYTPGHTDESFSYVLTGGVQDAVFTGDALLIRGTGRTDFQGGDAGKSWDSITRTLFTLPDDTVLYPGHDYKGRTSSSIGEEKRANPRLAGKTRHEYIDIMNGLRLPSPAMMDIAVPANLGCGRT